MSRLRKTLRACVIGAVVMLMLPAVAFTAGQEEAAEDFPTREIELMVPWGAGGATDITFRTFAAVLPKYLGTSIIIDNQPGGAAVPGYTEALNREGDGYFYVAWANASLTVTHMRETPFDANSFEPVINLVTSPVWILAPADSPYETLVDLVEDAQSRPGEVALGNAGAGGGTHIIALAFQDAADADFNHVPHNGGGPAVTAAMGGHVDAIVVGPPEGVSQIESGDLRCLGIFSEERLEAFPNQPTAVEQGIDFTLSQWRGVAAPKGTPREYIDHVHDAFKATMEDEEFKRLADDAGLLINYMGTDEFAEHVQEQDEFFENLIKTHNLGEKY